jgi:hypothetical protein
MSSGDDSTGSTNGLFVNIAPDRTLESRLTPRTPHQCHNDSTTHQPDKVACGVRPQVSEEWNMLVGRQPLGDRSGEGHYAN